MPRDELERGPARVLLSADEPQYFVGENVLIHYCLENTGSSPISIYVGGDYRGSHRSIRFKVTVTGEDGRAVPDPEPMDFNMGGIGYTPKLEPGESWCQSLPLLRYARIERAGTYTVTVAHDLGWKGPAPAGSMSLRFVMPDEREAGQVIDRALALSKDSSGRAGKKRAPYADLEVLRVPVYLPALEARIATRKDRASELVMGIGSIASPDATSTLIRLANDPDASVSATAAKALGMRLPDIALMARESVSGRDFERRHLIETSYRPEHTGPAREVGKKLVASRDLDTATKGAWLLQCVGERADLPAIAAALDRGLEATLAPPDRSKGFYETPRGITAMLLIAATIFAKRGLFPDGEPKTAGDFAVWLTAFETRDDFRPKGWEGVLARAMDHSIPRVRELALEAIPASAPQAITARLPLLLTDADPDVQVAACQAIERIEDETLALGLLALLKASRDDRVLSAAQHAAWMLGLRFPALLLAAERLTDAEVSARMLSFLASVVTDAPGHSASAFGPGQATAAKALWIPFLTANEAWLRRGGGFPAGDPQITREMLPGMTLHRDDGSKWP